VASYEVDRGTRN